MNAKSELGENVHEHQHGFPMIRSRARFADILELVHVFSCFRENTQKVNNQDRK